MIGRMRQRMNSRKSGDERLGYLEGSLQLLLDTLLEKLKQLNVELVPNAPVEKITFENNRVTAINTPFSNYTGKNFLFTIPGTYLAPLLEKEQPQLARRLSSIQYFGAVCVILELSQPLSDIYWLNIADEGFPFGGIIEHTNFIAEREYNGSHIAYLSRYFAGEEAIASMTEEEIKGMMIKQLPKIYPGFDNSRIKNSFVFRTNTAATVCDLNFSEKVPGCKTEIDNLYIANMSHVYPDERSTNNSIKIAAEALRCMGISTGVPEKTNSLSGKIGF
jgi:protoporphyrinogen oxidase